MSKSWIGCVVTGALCACGETVNYETREKQLLAAVDNAGDATGSEASSDIQGSSPESIDPEQAQAACKGQAWLVQEAQLKFPELPTGTTCQFDKGDMMSRKDGYMRAYHRQTQTLEIPEGAILCGFELTHKEAALRYDDEMFFLLQNTILMATKDYSEYFPGQDMFRSFSWEGLRDKPYDQFDDRPLYCLGGTEGFSQCELPPTDTRGTISLELTPEMSENLALSLGRQRSLNFDWITTGDNDSSDCRHTAIQFDVKLQYVLE